ncbi:hypothetical protein K469DRAFT_217516 [Zopfia rhizophila CBS 207.26]|uniref:Uncharacterized protein n=1 Tax=Zopfia rhizophila CBS 207.26 TaxID=1314779 RepID=A0A6A6DXM0_9PEZI|nr:hypothetical protein K469DRAFT_217516 [Zopfia rhizophila CBS 207.26]
MGPWLRRHKPLLWCSTWLSGQQQIKVPVATCPACLSITTSSPWARSLGYGWHPCTFPHQQFAATFLIHAKESNTSPTATIHFS